MKGSGRAARVAAMAVMFLASGLVARAGEEASAGDRFLRDVRQLTFEGNRAGEAYFSADGRKLVFQSERDADNPFYQIFILDLVTGETHRVSNGTGKTTCAYFHPSGERVIFASTHLDPEAKSKQQAELDFRAAGKERRYSWDYDEHYDVFSTTVDASHIERLTDATGYDAECSYSPDGERVVFTSIRDAYPASKLPAEERERLETDPSYFAEIYIMDADGSHETRLTDWPGYDGGPFFSPDGERILWRHFDETGAVADIYTMRTDGAERRRLTDFESMSWAPYFHPSGRYVVFTANKEGFSNFELYLVDADGRREPVRVTNTDGFDGLPVFSPDGRRLVWTSNRTPGGKSQIFIAGWDHAAALAALGSAPERNQDSDHQFSSDIRAVDLRQDVSYLASDELEGRMSGSRGSDLAARYIANRFETLGLAHEFQEFPFTSGMSVVEGENVLVVDNANAEEPSRDFALDEDFRPLAFTENGEVEGEVVFAGYGLRVPGDGEDDYDSYAGLDVADRVVVALRYVPEEVSVERRQELNHYAGLRYKALIARENGAKALLVVTGPSSPNAGELIPISFDQSLQSSGIVVASISKKVADALFAGTGKSLEDAQNGLDVENPHVEGAFALDGVRVRVRTTVQRDTETERNVIARIPPAHDGGDPEYVVVGAHYDHIGYGEIGSLAHKGEEGLVHNGADDNASGTALVLELAGALSQAHARRPETFRRGVLVALWSGEELGIIGSSYFVKHPTVPADGIIAYLNFDMVGRLRDNKLTLQGVGSSDAWRGLIEQKNVAAGFNLSLQDDPYLPTDVTAFYPQGVPVLSFFTGSHEDYNRPSDDADKLDYDGIERIAGLAYAMVLDLVKRPDRPTYAKVERTKGEQGQRASLRAYLGTIPDYTSDEVDGVKLSGVRAGGPADKAGLRGGDVIVQFAGQKITNIYDYTYALDAVKIGQPVEVVVLRDRERLTLTVVPEARK